MFYPSLAFVFAAALFLAIVITLALRPSSASRVITVVVIISAAIALCFYGFGYGMAAVTAQDAFIAACRTMLSTTMIFLGRENFSELCKLAPWFASRKWMQILFWLTHMAALYATASTVLSTIGARLLRMLRTLTLRFCKVAILYSDGENTLPAIQELSKMGYRPVLVSDENISAIESGIDAAGGVIWSEGRITEDGQWLSRMGIRPGSGKLKIICMGGNDGKTAKFLHRVIAALRAKSIDTKQLHICVICQSEVNFDFLPQVQLQPGRHLAADIHTVPYLAAETLISAAGPYRSMRFDPLGNADGDFCALVVGFGKVGQNVLRLLVRSAQFNSSSFSAVVVDRDVDASSGLFSSLYGDMLGRYDISFREMDARSESFVKLLNSLAGKLRYIVICTGNPSTDRRIVQQISAIRMCHSYRFSPRLLVSICSEDSITLCGGLPEEDSSLRFEQEHDLCIPVLQLEKLIEGRTDILARAVNSIYLKETALHRFPDDKTARESFYTEGWYSLSNVSRMSCRAAAGAIPAMLAAAGAAKGGKEALAACRERLETDADFRGAMSRMEHMRWNAFESSIGVLQMPQEEFGRRVGSAMGEAQAALEALSALKLRCGTDSPGEIKVVADRVYDSFHRVYAKVRKDIPSFGVGGIHACLTDWESLKPLWEIYEPLELRAGQIEQARGEIMALLFGAQGSDAPPAAQNFQQLDTNNVEGIFAFLAQEKT